jgi:hypothetical protein
MRSISLLTLVFIGALPALATPVLYTIDFSLTQDGPLPTSGSFIYDASASAFTSFDVVWDGDTFDLTSAANTYTSTSPTDPCFSGSTNGAQEVFLLMTACSADDNASYYTAPPQYEANIYPYGSPNYTNFQFLTTASTNPGPNQMNLYTPAVGTSGCPADTCYTYSAQVVGEFEATAATPEPGSCALTLIGLCLVMRKRIATSIRQVTGTHS